MAKGRTGGADGRSGGRLSAGSRAQTALRRAPRVRVLGTVASTHVPLQPEAAVAVAGLPSHAQLAATSHAALAMGQMLGLSPA